MPETTTAPPAKAKKLAAGATGFLRVDHPEVWPQRCVRCHSATNGPFVDTKTEGVGAGNGRADRIYFCSQCVKLAALELGLIDGSRMEELLAADAKLAVSDKAGAEKDLIIQKQMADLAAATRKAEALEELLQQERDRGMTHKHLFDMIEQSAIQGRQAS